MNKRLFPLSVLAVLAACQPQTEATAPIAATAPALESGIDFDGMNMDIRPQDDFFAYANDGWVQSTEIPSDQSGWGSFNILRDTGLEQLQTIIADATDAPENEGGAKIGNFYKAWMDEARVNSRGIAPLAKIFADIDGLTSHAEVAAFFGTSKELGLRAPFNVRVSQDVKSPDRYVVIASQSGLGLPDRDYYFDDSERGLQLRDAYRTYIETMFDLAGSTDATEIADRLMQLETRLAEHQWTRVANRDPVARYNKLMDAELDELLSNIDLDAYFAGIGSGRQEYVIVSQPSYMQAFNELFPEIPLATWREYEKLQAINSYAAYLATEYVDTRFNFFNKTLRGQEEQQPRWKSAISSVNRNLGELLGQLYVEKHFPPVAKSRMEVMVSYLILAYEE